MSASLTIRGFLQLQKVDLGFRADRVLMVGFQLSPKRYAKYEQRVAFSERALAARSLTPDVGGRLDTAAMTQAIVNQLE